VLIAVGWLVMVGIVGFLLWREHNKAHPQPPTAGSAA
jgi:hypothetical protein